MRWADICWFEWCDELIIYASKLEIAKGKKIICRLHSYEAFTGYTHQVNWDNIDKVIFVAEHIRDFVIKSVKSLEKEQTVVIPNGIDTNKFKFKKREKGFNIAYVGYINYKKGPMLLLHTFKAIYDRDNRYKLYIAGQFQDYRYLLYFEQMIKEMGLENNVIFDGWQDDIDSWLDDKNYIISTSVLESQHLSTMEAMSKGIKPIIHNFVGAKDIYKDKYIWNTIDEAVEMIVSDEYDSEEYRQFIVDNYLLKTQTLIILKLLLEIRHNKYIDKSTVIKLGDIKEMVEEFIPYDFTYVNNYNTDGCNILIGKIEKVDSRFDYIECILKNKFAEQLIISGVWYDNINKKILLPSYLLKSEKLDYIDQLINEILHFEVKYSNNIGGFILDEEILEDFQKNKVAYMWERGIPATQFMPLFQYLKIIARYKFASKYISKNDLILEAASGFGYGAAYLSKKCNKVVALDIAEENIDFGRNTYKFNNIDWIKGDVLNLPYQNNTFDKYISFETLEHLPVEQVKLYLNEALRVLKPDSKFIISTPNEATRKNVHNPFHIKEYNFNEFKSLLEVFFKDIEYFSVKDYQIMEGISDNANNMLAVCSKF